MMRAIAYEQYGPPDVLEMREVEMPTVGDHDVLVRVKSASVNRSDWERLVGSPFYVRLDGLRAPKTQILGTDVAGVVEQVGSAVQTFRPGDEVFGDVMYHGGKTFAEYVSVPDNAVLVPKPAALTFAEASTLPQAGVIALQGMAGVAEGDRVLINGAGGGGGAFATQLAKAAGAHVTGVDNGHKLEFIRSLGADEAIDYTTTDYTRTGPYDRILDLVCERSIFAIRKAVADGGRYRVVGGHTRSLLSAATIGRLLSVGSRSLGVLLVRPNRDDLARLGEMAASGELRTTIDEKFPLEGVPDALARLGEGRALGKLVVEVG